MRDSIQKMLPHHEIIESDAEALFIADYKNLNRGGVVMLDNPPKDIRYVKLDNKNLISICFDGFKENALPVKPGEHSQQCECVTFPSSCNHDDWVLFVECKYTYDLKTATNVKYGYPQKMLDQIIETVSYFRNNGILENNRRATAIVSFPNLMHEFNSTFFSGRVSELDILKNHNILIRATNSATIKSSKRIKLNSI